MDLGWQIIIQRCNRSKEGPNFRHMKTESRVPGQHGPSVPPSRAKGGKRKPLAYPSLLMASFVITTGVLFYKPRILLPSES